MKRVLLIPNAITAFALSCGLFVIFKTSIVGASGADLFALLQASAILILLAAVADVADGAVARLIRAESEFGVYFDSLADAVTFGVAPPLLVLKTVTGEVPRPLTLLAVIASMIFTLCGVLRLVRFNVRARRAKEDPKFQKEENRHFTGLPIPAAASAAIALNLFLISPLFREVVSLTEVQRVGILVVMLGVLGYFMVSRWKFPSIKALHFRVPLFYLILATGVLFVFVFYGITEYFPLLFVIASWLYLVVAWLLSAIRLIAGRRSKTLEEFEPDEEE